MEYVSITFRQMEQRALERACQRVNSIVGADQYGAADLNSKHRASVLRFELASLSEALS